MQLTSDSNSVHNTTFSTPDRSFAYKLETSSWPSKKTQISGGRNGRAVGWVQIHRLSEDEVVVNGREIVLERAGFMSNQKVFRASNNQIYKWKASPQEATLKDDQKRVMAIFERGHSGFIRTARPASLHIEAAALPIVDEIFVTFVYMQQKERQRYKGGGGDGGGGGG